MSKRTNDTKWELGRLLISNVILWGLKCLIAITWKKKKTRHCLAKGVVILFYMPLLMKLPLKSNDDVYFYLSPMCYCVQTAKAPKWTEKTFLGLDFGQPLHLQTSAFRVHRNDPLQQTSVVISWTTQACRDEPVTAGAEQKLRHKTMLKGPSQHH